MEKKYIEFILENQEHMKKIEELEKISREYMDYLLDKIEITSNDVSISDSKVHNWGYIESEFEKLIVDNYFVDNECDYFGMIEDGYNQAYFHHSPQMLIDAIKKEQEKRHTRKRHPKKSWEKLKSFSLEKVGEQMRDQVN
ncbi:hypothetical protein P4V74_17370 [Bacillus thuringiensis]|nr:hypothetical protein [Bacillus thuringiensis]